MPAAASPVNRQPGSHQRQAKMLPAIGFGGLLLLMCLLSASSISFLYQIERRHEAIRQDYVKRESMLEKIRAGIYVSGTYFRDFVMDDDDAHAARDRAQFLSAETETRSRTADYERLFVPADEKAFPEFRTELNAYFGVLAPALPSNAQQRRQYASKIIREQLLPRRMMLISLSDRVQQYSENQLAANSQMVSDMFATFRTRLLSMFALTIAIGATLAAVTMWRLLNLEHISAASYGEAIAAREELKQLSAELLSAQEDERRRISRELHDEVGQVLSAIMLGLGNIRALLKKDSTAEAILRQLQLIENMTERSTRVVRNLSLVLRPTMLDDLGLIAALKWLAREISRTGPLQVEVIADDAPDELPEEHRTCVYRVVQEAVRNIARHSGAHHARIVVDAIVDARASRLSITVQDDGKGFNPQFEKGMGILGMEERVTRLGGSFHVDSEVGRGTKLSFALPLPQSIASPADLPQDTRPLRTA